MGDIKDGIRRMFQADKTATLVIEERERKRVKKFFLWLSCFRCSPCYFFVTFPIRLSPLPFMTCPFLYLPSYYLFYHKYLTSYYKSVIAFLSLFGISNSFFYHQRKYAQKGLINFYKRVYQSASQKRTKTTPML
jgi:hypothetical protein